MRNLQKIVASLILTASAMAATNEANAQYSPTFIQSTKPSPNTEFHRTYTGKDRFIVGDLSTYVSSAAAAPVAPSTSLVGKVKAKLTPLSASEKDYKRFTDKYKKQADAIMADINQGKMATASIKVQTMKKSLESESKGNNAYSGFAKEYLGIVDKLRIVEFEFYNLDIGTTTRSITDKTWPTAIERAPASVISLGLETAIKPLDIAVAGLLGRDMDKAARFRSQDVYWKNVTQKSFHPESSQQLLDVKEYKIGDKVANWHNVKLQVPQSEAPVLKQNYINLKMP